MFRRTAITAAAVAALAAAGLAGAQFADAGTSATLAAACSTYEVVTVRGTGEQVVDGVPVTMKPAIDAIKARVRGVTTFNVPYPAAFDTGDSMAKGRALTRQHLVDLAGRCPAQKVVLMGYSQGAIVVGDVVEAEVKAGRNLPVGVLSIILFGDGRFNGAAPYDYGSYNPKKSSVIVRPVSSFAPYANRVRDYCNVDDPACQWFVWGSGHTDYQKYGTDVGEFVASKV